jgi:NarL family two-component system sensor histidine kinase YdfH
MKLMPPLLDLRTIKLDFRRVAPFYGLLTVSFAFLYGLVLTSDPLMRTPAALLPFTLLMFVHLALHWCSLVLTEDLRWRVIYLVVQGILAFSLVQFTHSTGLVIGLYMGLIGESFGMLGANWRGAAALVVFLSLSYFNLNFIAGDFAFTNWLLMTFPLAVFVTIFVYMYLREIRANEKTQNLLVDLERVNQKLTEYADTIEDLTLTNERERMARELHDTLAQGLAGVILQLEAADSHLSNHHPERAQVIVQQAMDRARTALNDARRAIDNLRSFDPARDDLAANMRAAVDQFQASSGVPCKLEISLPDPVSEGTSDTVMRIVSEAFANIARHARASQAWVVLRANLEELEIEIGDNGAGFSVPDALPILGHYGIQGMRERTREGRGSMEIQSVPGKGTVIRVRLPVDREKI